MSRRQPDFLKGAAAGLIAGLAATWVMTNFQTAWSKVEEARKEPKKGEQGTPESEHDEPATVKAAEAISRTVFHHELADQEKEVAGNAAHFAFGTLTGGIYGVVAEAMPEATALDGAAFGTAVWLGADNLAVPAMKLSKWPNQVPFSKNVYGFLAHLVYGCATEIFRRMLRRVL
jgi:putative membrane protein